MEKYKYRGRKITALIARQLINELFSGKDAVSRQKIVEDCEKEHLRRGGIKHESPNIAFKGALKDLKLLGVVEDSGFGYWHINAGFTQEEALAPIPLPTGSLPLPKEVHIKSELWGKQAGRCASCNRALAQRDLTLDHIVPKSRGGGDEKTNMQLLCTSCNSSKGAKTQDEFMKARDGNI